jgi:hypothetical protein
VEGFCKKSKPQCIPSLLLVEAVSFPPLELKGSKPNGTKKLHCEFFIALYWVLGLNSEERTKAYIELFRCDLSIFDMQHIRDTLQTVTPLVNDEFLKKTETLLCCKVRQARRGRPSIVRRVR